MRFPVPGSDVSTESFPVRLTSLQPSQLYVSRAKLERVEDADGPLESLPVIRLDGRLVLTDGHTRAAAAWRAGARAVRVRMDPDEPDLDLEAYAACVSWCRDAGIVHVGHLAHRILEPEAYQRLWYDRCDALHERLRTRRAEGR